MSINKPKQQKKESRNKELAKKLTEEEVRDLMLTANIGSDPKAILKKIGEEIIPRYATGSKKEKDNLVAEFTTISQKALFALGLDSHLPLVHSVGEAYRPMVIEYVRQLEKEYDCRTPSEKMLAQTIVNAHARVMEYSLRLNGLTEAGHLSHEKNGYYAVISKELDRAQRHFLNALSTLKQIKNPAVEINVKAKTAFVAQNQQINTDVVIKPQTEETNEAK